jgi:poly-gamma-glutamate capsule biosynthesis protein CapA/YwtB (metallophosphatase superfamily)
MSVRLVLAGDTMLGRGVAERLRTDPLAPLVSPEIIEITREADLLFLNLECCISDRGQRWPDPMKPFFFRAPPVAVETLSKLGTSCVTVGNNHALDYGTEALEDTFRHLDAAGIAWVGAGPEVGRARAPAVLEAQQVRIAILGVTDHPAGFAALPDRPGVAYADLRTEVPNWLTTALSDLRSPASDVDVVIVSPHWGPNMVAQPVAHVRRAARTLIEAGATMIAGHSAHVFHGVSGPVLYDLGDFLDDYATDRLLRNDLGLLFVVTLDRAGPRRIEVVPLALDYCFTRLAEGDDAAWVRNRFRHVCHALGTMVSERSGRLVVDLENQPAPEIGSVMTEEPGNDRWPEPSPPGG